MQLVTVCTHSDGYYAALVAAAKAHHFNLVTLGFGLKWRGFTWRFQLLTEYLAKQPDTELIVVSDAYDVVVRRDAQELAARFRELKVPAVFSMDRSFLHAPRWYPGRYAFHKKFPFAPGYHLCAGVYMGTAKGLRCLLRAVQMMPNDYNDDQRMFAFLTHVHPELIHLDVDSRLFHNLSAFPAHNESALIDRACLVHAPGNLDLSIVVARDRLPPGKAIGLATYTLRLLPTTLHLFRHELSLIIMLIVSAMLVLCYRA